uniref:Uncharacterized protein n=1 Tax=Human herpesvirus 2 TaxID=10310 RepID=A0A481T9L0_HHV2|nr:hypothetical protein [Human alphaherpesvirus 2]QBH77748.1 hypothetical protein [Human alphaherpesvirus 2]QBH77839.1 hypothetical protein [Human alphaherpesvirus 2]
MLIAIKWLIVITVYWVVFFWGGRKMQKRVRNSRNFTPGGGASAVTQFLSVWEIY